MRLAGIAMLGLIVYFVTAYPNPYGKILHRVENKCHCKECNFPLIRPDIFREGCPGRMMIDDNCNEIKCSSEPLMEISYSQNKCQCNGRDCTFARIRNETLFDGCAFGMFIDNCNEVRCLSGPGKGCADRQTQRCTTGLFCNAISHTCTGCVTVDNENTLNSSCEESKGKELIDKQTLKVDITRVIKINTIETDK